MHEACFFSCADVFCITTFAPSIDNVLDTFGLRVAPHVHLQVDKSNRANQYKSTELKPHIFLSTIRLTRVRGDVHFLRPNVQVKHNY